MSIIDPRLPSNNTPQHEALAHGLADEAELTAVLASPSLAARLIPSTKEQWVIKYNGQIIPGYKDSELFTSQSSAKRSFTELINCHSSMYHQLAKSRNVSGPWPSGMHVEWTTLVRLSEKKLIKQLIDTGTVTFERIR